MTTSPGLQGLTASPDIIATKVEWVSPYAEKLFQFYLDKYKRAMTPPDYIRSRERHAAWYRGAYKGSRHIWACAMKVYNEYSRPVIIIRAATPTEAQ